MSVSLCNGVQLCSGRVIVSMANTLVYGFPENRIMAIYEEQYEENMRYLIF